jgi:hypothetical protein
MRRLTLWASAALVPALVASLLAVGCGGNGGTQAPTKPKPPATTPGAGAGAQTELASTGWGTLKGRVTLDGTVAGLDAKNKAIEDAMGKQADKSHCLSEAAGADKEQQVWRIGKDNGLANVFVWLKAPKGKFFKIHPDLTKPKDVEMDQPFCAFIPHCAVLFPKMVDPANPDDLKPTGQKLIVKNSAPINHNTNWSAPDQTGGNKIIPRREGDKINSIPIDNLEPSDTPVRFKCDVHGWMSAYVRVFDHPYAVVTDKDGNFEIKNAPAGVDVSVVVWHEEGEYGDGGKDGTTVKLEDGKTVTKDFKIRAK